MVRHKKTPPKGGALTLYMPIVKLSFSNTGGVNVSPYTLSVTAHRQNALRYSNSEASIQFYKTCSAPYSRHKKYTLLNTHKSIAPHRS